MNTFRRVTLRPLSYSKDTLLLADANKLGEPTLSDHSSGFPLCLLYSLYRVCTQYLSCEKDSRVIISATVRFRRRRFPDDAGRGFRSVPKHSSVVLLNWAQPRPIGRNERMLYVTNRWTARQSARQTYLVTVRPMLQPTNIGLLGHWAVGRYICSYLRLYIGLTVQTNRLMPPSPHRKSQKNYHGIGRRLSAPC